MTFYLLDNENANAPKRSNGKRGFYYPTRSKDIQGIVVHTAENLPDYEGADSGAENVAKYFATTSRGVSAHVVVDSDSTVVLLPDDHVAFQVRGYNSVTIGIEIATQAHTWHADPTGWEMDVLANTAREVAVRCRTHNIPVTRVSTKDFKAGAKGILSHAQLDPARRSDPGKNFPWDIFMELVEENLNAPKPKKSIRTWEQELLVKLGTLKRGDRGAGVIRLQHLLNIYGQSLKRDGIFGPNTERAVFEAQERLRTPSDGVVGPKTWACLLTDPNPDRG